MSNQQFEPQAGKFETNSAASLSGSTESPQSNTAAGRLSPPARNSNMIAAGAISTSGCSDPEENVPLSRLLPEKILGEVSSEQLVSNLASSDCEVRNELARIIEL